MKINDNNILDYLYSLDCDLLLSSPHSKILVRYIIANKFQSGLNYSSIFVYARYIIFMKTNPCYCLDIERGKFQ